MIRVSVTRPDGSPLQGVTVAAIDAATHIEQDSGVSDNGGIVELNTSGAFYLRPRVTGDRHRVAVVNFGNSSCYDYIVDVDGGGTHLTIQAAWEDIKDTSGDKSVYICPGNVGPLAVDINGDNNASGTIHWVGTRAAVILGYSDLAQSGNSAKDFVFEGVTFDDSNPGSTFAIDRSVGGSRNLFLRDVDCRGPVRNRSATYAWDTHFLGNNVQHAYDGAGNGHFSFFKDCDVVGSIRPGGEEYWDGCTTDSPSTCLGNIGVHANSGDNSAYFRNHTFRSSGTYYIAYFTIGSYTHVDISGTIGAAGIHPTVGTAAVRIESAFNYNGTSIRVVDNRWECNGKPGMLIESSNVNELIYQGNSHGNTAPGYVAVLCSGAGSCAQSVFGPNTPADLVYNVAGSGNIFFPGSSAVGTSTGGDAPGDAQYLVLSGSTALSAERVFTPRYNMYVADGGANGSYTVDSWIEGAPIAAAATLTLGTDGDVFHVTGTTTITAIATPTRQTLVLLVFDGAVLLTHGPNLILQGAANFLTSAGDALLFMWEGGATWREVNRHTAATVSGGDNTRQTYIGFGTVLPSGYSV